MPISASVKSRRSLVRRVLMGSTALVGFRRAAAVGGMAAGMALWAAGPAAGQVLDLMGQSQTITDFGANTTVKNDGPGAAILTVDVPLGNLTFGGSIEDGTATTSLTKIGGGILTLDGVNTYSGVTTIDNGEIVLGIGGKIERSAISLSIGATLNASSGNKSIVSLEGAGGTVTIGTSTLTLTG
ncbi:autotransporter-associated beta strand repeat-containing protein, partial [uncultured Alsobacter sp.]|uniref:autotransporter-associated beta strand repeat-containing protein n=1 Tax=uncultured Alsobacter sp. TaxID=1748258 RepID=UPI0025F74D80